MQTLSSNPKLQKQISFSQKQAIKQDQTENIANSYSLFNYEECRNSYWNPEEYSFLYGTYLWNQSSESQKKLLNHIYWIAYYSQIISAEIATIYFNQIAAAGLFIDEDFSEICMMLDLESRQERTHIKAFRHISKEAEQAIFGKTLFSYPMKDVFENTMLHEETNALTSLYRKLQLYGYTLIASQSIFIAAQYLLIRGIRTLNGKIIQEKLSNFIHKKKYEDLKTAPIPSQISYYHFIDESFHFNTSKLISLDLVDYLPQPNNFDKWITNQLVFGSQKDHKSFSVAINGIFWFDPALFSKVLDILTSKHFSMSKQEALQIMRKSYCEESEGMHQSYKTIQIVKDSYIKYVEPVDFLEPVNKNMEVVASNSIEKQLRKNILEFNKFESKVLLKN